MKLKRHFRHLQIIVNSMQENEEKIGNIEEELKKALENLPSQDAQQIVNSGLKAADSVDNLDDLFSRQPVTIKSTIDSPSTEAFGEGLRDEARLRVDKKVLRRILQT